MQKAGNQNGQLQQADFSENTGGLNLVESVFKISPNQAAGGFNFDYPLTGGVHKRLGPLVINSSPDAQLTSLGFGMYTTAAGSTKAVLRAAGTKLQLFDPTTPLFTSLSQDTAAASTTPFVSGSTETVNFSQFNNGTSNILWAAGGGASLPVGAYSTTKYTANGIAVPAGAFTGAVNAHNSGSWTVGGAYYYAIAYRKASTQVLSNAVLDITKTVVNTDDTVTLDFTGLTGLDTTLVDKIYIYRSAVSGVTAFTTGSLIAQLSSGTSTFVDKGNLGNPDISSTINIQRAGNTVLDYAALPAGTYNAMTMFKQRLVVAQNSTVYISNSGLSESWPALHQITIPSAGPITALARVSFTSPQAQSLNELLVIFKQSELWVITGTGTVTNSIPDWTLLSIDDSTGCPQQSLIVNAQGWLAWVDFRGVHLWDGTGKPYYASRLIEPLFNLNGDLDKSQLSTGTAEFFKRENQILWYLSSKTYGAQKLVLKMDTRLTLPLIDQTLTGRNIDGIFLLDSYAVPVYAAMAHIPLNGAQEQMVVGDNTGTCYYASNSHGDGASGIAFSYLTPPLSMGDPNTMKHFQKVVVWVQDVGTHNLELDWWVNYKTDTAYQSSKVLPLSTEGQQTTALYDIAAYDVSFYDAYYPSVVPIVFNIAADSQNNVQGSAIQLQFQNSNINEPITIHGYSVMWSEMGGIT